MEDIKHVESSLITYYTTDYKMFKYLKGNRNIIMSKVRKIAKEIRNGNNQLRYQAIMVNKNMEILDGQHRHAAAELTGEKIFYVINDEGSLEIVPGMNSNSSNWKGEDFLGSYIDMGKPAYISLRRLMREFEGIGLAVAASLIHSGFAESKGVREIFTEGNLTDDKIDYTREILSQCKDFAPYCSKPYSRKLITALSELNGNGKYDHKLMVRKLQESGVPLTRLDSAKALKSEMETIINFRARTRIVIF